MAKELTEMFKELKRYILLEFKELLESLERDVRKDIREIKQSMQFFNETFEEMKGSVSTVKKENVELKQTVATLEGECKVLRAKLKDQEIRLMQGEQYATLQCRGKRRAKTAQGKCLGHNKRTCKSTG